MRVVNHKCLQKSGRRLLQTGRSRQFARDADALVAEVRAVPGDLLGHAAADERLLEWAPDIAERARAAGR